MGVSRRSVLSGVVAAPVGVLVASTPAAAATASASGQTGQSSGGWVEIWPTSQTLAQLDQIGAAVQAVAPAELVQGSDGSTGLRMPVTSAQGNPSLLDPALAQGSGALDGGILVHNADGAVQFTQLDGVVQGGQLSGQCQANNEAQALQPALTWRTADLHITVIPGQLGEPLTLRVTKLPVYPTQESIDAFTRAFGTPIFTTDTVMAHINAEGPYLSLLQ